ncbi:MAG: cohesin domain-containing protein, partial [Defluviitaleaceae bacterium]|nr:cohesin domain-containing protein [Defluviitaleaceae bacterium]
MKSLKPMLITGLLILAMFVVIAVFVPGAAEGQLLDTPNPASTASNLEVLKINPFAQPLNGAVFFLFQCYQMDGTTASAIRVPLSGELPYQIAISGGIAGNELQALTPEQAITLRTELNLVGASHDAGWNNLWASVMGMAAIDVSTGVTRFNYLTQSTSNPGRNNWYIIEALAPPGGYDRIQGFHRIENLTETPGTIQTQFINTRLVAVSPISFRVVDGDHLYANPPVVQHITGTITFTLEIQNGAHWELVDTAQNDADGWVSFDSYTNKTENAIYRIRATNVPLPLLQPTGHWQFSTDDYGQMIDIPASHGGNTEFISNPNALNTGLHVGFMSISPTPPPSPTPQPTIVPGNVTGSGTVSSADVGMLRAYLSGFPVPIIREAANVSGSGQISSADVGLIRAYLAGFPVVLQPASRANVMGAFMSLSNPVSVSTTSANASPRDYVDIQIRIDENSGLTSLDLNVGYDAAVLERISITPYNLMNLPTQPPPDSNPFRLNFDLADPLGTTTDTGPIATMRFRILESATSGSSPVNVSLVSAYVVDGFVFNPIGATVTSGSVDITATQTPPPTPSPSPTPTPSPSPTPTPSPSPTPTPSPSPTPTPSPSPTPTPSPSPTPTPSPSPTPTPSPSPTPTPSPPPTPTPTPSPTPTP